MNFASVEFFYFLTGVLALYFFLGRRGQNRFLLVASYLFYGWWDYRFLALLFTSSVVDFYCARKIASSQQKRKKFLLVSLGVNLGALGFFKYSGFFAASLVQLAQGLGLSVDEVILDFVLPVGISFYTFQSLSYTIDVYRGKVGTHDSFEEFLLYVSFFPQLVAGPIERAPHLLPQIAKDRTVSAGDWNSGLQLILVGLFKKMVIADNLASIVDPTFASSNPTGGAVLIAIYAFAYQIYCDFSGYTDIARGVARMLGFDLCRNFNSPYLSANPAEFWRRWHISLSSWLRDYLYISLGGNRLGALFTCRNLLITMVLGGLWHGASWTFVLWGAYQGGLLGVHRVVQPWLRSMRFTGGLVWRGVSVFLFFHFCCYGWLIFRADGVEQLKLFSAKLISPDVFQGIEWSQLVMLTALTLPLLVFHLYKEWSKRAEPWGSWPFALRWGMNLLVLYGIVFFGDADGADFIYFQF